MKKLDLLLLRDGTNNGIQYVAIEDYNLIVEGPHQLKNENRFLNELAVLEKCLTDSASRPDKAAMTGFGIELAEALFPGEIRQLVRVDADSSLKLGICCTDPQLKRIPWEYLVWPGGQQRSPIANKSIARLVPVGDGAETRPARLRGRKLRVALIVSDPSEMGAVPWDELERSLRDTFEHYLKAQGISKGVDLVLIGDISKNDINMRISQEDFDVIHFIGHGEPDGLYMLNRSDKKAELVPVEAIVPLFCRPSVQLVLLSACSTGKQRKGTAIAPLAEELVRNMVPAVVGSQLPIPASTIAIFCASLYQKLIATGDIDEAVAFGRTALQIELSTSGAGSSIEWGIPVLYRRPGRSKLFA